MSVLADIHTLGSLSPIELRRWFVSKVVLAPTSSSLLATADPGTQLLEAAQGRGSSSEHCGIAARILYEYMKRPNEVLTLPTIASPKSWNNANTMTDLMLWAFEPWKTWRYDPRSETVSHTLDNGQWAFHLKGKDTEGFVAREIERMIVGLNDIGFSTIIESLHEQGFLSLTPSDYGVEASEFGLAMQASQSAFHKFCTRQVVKEVMDHLFRAPIMFFDTSTVNCIQNLIAVGNGVIPTDDFIDISDESDFMTLPAGKLIPADIEFCLSSATGLAWPDFPAFNDLMDYRARIYHGLAEESFDEWMDGARQVSDWILLNKCPTYSSFLDHAFPADPTPQEREAFLRVLGAACFGTNLKLVTAMIGKANAGKDTVLKWLSWILGDGQVGVLAPTALGPHADDQRAFAPLKGARVAVISGEVGEGRSTALLADKIKSITSGGGTLTVAEKYEKPTTIFFDGMLIMQGNSVPSIQGGDEALYRNRLVAVKFKHPFPRKAYSYEKEYRQEAPWFLQVLFLSYLQYQWEGGGMDGINPPEEWQTFSKEIEIDADPLGIIDACLTQPSRSVEIQSPIFYRALSILAEKQLGIRYPVTAQRWSQRLKRAGIEFGKTNNKYRSRVGRSDYTGWVMHFTLDADQSNGFFTQQDWTNAIAQATMASNL